MYACIGPLFYPYGLEYGDTKGRPVLDDAFGPVLMDTPIVIFQSIEDSIYVRQSILVNKC